MITGETEGMIKLVADKATGASSACTIWPTTPIP